MFSNASMIEKNNILILNFSRYITNFELTIITLRETEYFFPFFCRADLRLYAVLHRLEMERERERGFVHQDRIDSQERESNGP